MATQRAGRLSGGMRRRLVLTLRDAASRALAARALAACPAVTRVQPAEPGSPLVVYVYVRDVAASMVPVIRRLDDEGVQITAIEQARASLDDVFLRYTGDRPRVEARVQGAVSSVFAAAHGRRAR